MTDKSDVRTEPDPRLRSALKWSDDLEAQFRILNETGLFQGHLDDASTVLQLIFRARAHVRAGDADKALLELGTGELKLQNCVYKENWFWRCTHMHQLMLFVYHVAAILLLLNIATGWLTSFASALWNHENAVPMAAMVAGGLGASLRGMWFLWLQVSKRIYRTQFLLAHLAAPWIGVLFGLFVFLLIRAALLTVGTPKAEDGNLALPLALCFLAGYSWEWILGRVDQVRTALATAAAKGAPSTKAPDAGMIGAPTPGAGGSGESSPAGTPRTQLPQSSVAPIAANRTLTDEEDEQMHDPLETGAVT